MAIENCDKCKAYGFTCNRANWLERLTGREKIVVLENTGQKFAHDFTIETCEVVTGEISAKKYAKTLLKYLDSLGIQTAIKDSIEHDTTL